MVDLKARYVTWPERTPPIAIAVVAAPCVSPPVADLIQLDLELCWSHGSAPGGIKKDPALAPPGIPGYIKP